MLTQNYILETVSDDELFTIASDLVRIPSYTGLENQELAVARYIHRFFENEKIDVAFQSVLEKRPNVVAAIKGNGEGRSLMLTGHMDTVPPYNATCNPFSGEIKGGKIYGRGACDMKGALACMMATMAAIKRSGIGIAGDLVFAGVVNEEQYSEGTEYIVKNGPYTDAAIVGEPTGLDIAAGHRGLEWIEIEITGKTTHGGTLSEGINAISKAAKLIIKIENELVPKFKKRCHPLIGEPLLNFGVIKGGDQPSIVAGKCSLYIDRRWTPSETIGMIMDDFEQIIAELKQEDKDFNASVRRCNTEMLLHKPMVIELDQPIVGSLKKGLLATSGVEGDIVAFQAWTDASLLSNFANIPSVVFGPGYLKNAHSPEEYVELNQLKGAYEAYTITAMDFCGG